LLHLFFACSSDDDKPSTTNPPDNTSELIDALVADITGGSETIWKISSATLTNNEVTNLDVSSAFNIVDDEYLFKSQANSQTITLEHKQGNDFNENASDESDFLLDYYKSSETFALTVTDLDAKEFSGSNKVFNFESNSSIVATITLNGGTLDLGLTPKTATDYAMPPSSGLNFTEAFTFESNLTSGNGAGVIGSNSENSLFIVTREDDLNNGTASPERVIKHNFNTNTDEEKLFFQSDFVSKQLHIQNNQLIALGAQYVNTYNLDLSQDPTSENHGRAYSRHGVAVQDNFMYAIGGCLDGFENSDCTKIHKWNLDTQTMSEVATLPEPRSGARCTIINNKLYIFGGTEAFFAPPANNTVFVYDIENDSFETLTMPQALDFTFVDRYQNLIYVAGQIRLDTNNDGTIDDNNAYVGVFNTEDNTFQEITTNLDDSDTNSSINAMCAFNNKMYIIYGVGIDNGGDFPEWSVLVADL
jgi:hypothetical protein